MASEDVKTRESAVSTTVNLSEEVELAREGVKTPGPALLSICKSLFAGGVAGGVSRTAFAPLERLKILLQYNGTIQGLKYIWRTEGLRGMFKGNGTNCARIVPNSAVKFFSYEEASDRILWFYRRQTGKANFGFQIIAIELNGFLARQAPHISFPLPDDAQLTPLLRLGAGACAGIIAMSATYPMDMVRGRLTVQRQVSSPVQRNRSCSLDSPQGGRSSGFIQRLGAIRNRSFEDNELGVETRLACGAAAGTAGQTVAYPLDVIRRRMQMVGWKDAASVVTGDGKGKAALEYTGMVDAFRKTVRHEGFGALYKGLVPNSVKGQIINMALLEEPARSCELGNIKPRSSKKD
ncbi:hypothetical protein DKX38_004639 [Salix brachista]|uniref:ADP/ATP translocase n=1 Tax=Salix brachista TaxID=2182728 RepID=A0A5N5NAK6_9ROSI|nr:hypothetical protein DKX38_004639 [Salix brachista]